ncbi:MAG: phosphopyruvate hydratase [Betaproteobacteria bacterium]|nr:phosphopyruvate hydratase [Betaproteobacteria bacterium]
MAHLVQAVHARRIWDSRGRPTVEVEVGLSNGVVGRGVAPAGASRGSREAVDLRDGGESLGGMDVQKALHNIRAHIAPAIRGMPIADRLSIDQRLMALDPSATRHEIGGNALIATSFAVLDAAARDASLPIWKYLSAGAEVRLPLPEIQIFGGGAHAGRRVDIQDFLVMPVGAQSFDEAMVMTAEVYRTAGQLMQEQGRRAGVADEGGWWPDFDSNEQALEMLARAITRAGYRFDQVAISLDIAASEFRHGGFYQLGLEGRRYTTDEWIEVLSGWIDRYPILSIEDPVAEDDTPGMQAFTQRWGDHIQIVGDDYLVTRAELVNAAAEQGACNAVLLKPNQVGTISETFSAMQAANRFGWGKVVSARSGETEDVMIVHLAIGWNAGQLKVGSFARSERMAKWNEALRIEEALGAHAVYAGRSGLPGCLRNPGQA